MVDIACYKKSVKTILLLFLFALIIEIFVFNYRSFSTAGYTEKSLDDSYTVELVGGSIDENGDIIMNSDADYVTLNIGGFGYPLNNIRLDIECPDDETTPFAIDHVCVAECRAYDDALFEMIDENGQSYLSEGSVALIERDILHSVEESHYIYLEPFGDTHRIQLVLYPASGIPQKLRIHELTFNAVRPLKVLPIRLIGMFLLEMLLYMFFFNGICWRDKCTDGKKRNTVIVVSAFLLFVFFTLWIVLLNRALLHEDFSPYSRLARAICEGHLYVDTAAEELAGTEGKSVYWREDSTQVLFDYAMYNGKYYVYFGVLPCIFFYLPYYALTGNDLPNIVPEIILRLLFVALMGRFLYILIKKYYKDIPLALFMLIWGALVCAAYIPAMLVGAVKFYDIPIFSGAVLVLAGACFWSEPEGEDGKIKIGRICLGSICMAAVSLCRPTMLIYGFILLFFLVWNRLELLRQQNKSELIKESLAICLPYFAFAVICMAYNALRFGSPFDFGVAYNTTTIPLTGAKLFLPYVVFRASYEYLFHPPFVAFEFPFSKFITWERIRLAGNHMVMDVFCGGLIAANPFTWSFAALSRYKESLKQKKLWNPILVTVITAFILMIYGVVCTGSIYTRYTLDFAPAVLLCAAVMVMEIYADVSAIRDTALKRRLQIVINFVLMVSIWWGVMQFCCGEMSIRPLSSGNTELWYKIYYSLRLFG